MSQWPMVPLGKLLIRRKDEILLDDLTVYPRLTIRLNGRGIVVRDRVPGSEIGTKRQFIARKGQLVLSKIDARNGAFGILPPEGDKSIITGNFWAFDHNSVRVDLRYLELFTKTQAFIELCVKASSGTTNRLYLQEDKFLLMEIPLPPLPEQRRLVERIGALAAKIEEGQNTTTQVARRSQQLLMAIFLEITRHAPNKRLGDVAPLRRRPATVEWLGEYPQVSVRSFGRGTFHNPPLLGSEITWEKPQLVKADDILISNIKAWEGAIAVARPEDDGRYGSHRYLTYVPVAGIATARFVCFFLLTPEGLHYVGEASPGSADRNRTTSARALLEIPIPLPSYDQQLWFGEIYDKVESLRRLQTEAASRREAMLPAILDRAFKSQL